uniref:Uncharacterized protein n=1 Tax=Equus asinus TaxID=9793 RepID=A0A9L0JVH9_EQUAS
MNVFSLWENLGTDFEAVVWTTVSCNTIFPALDRFHSATKSRRFGYILRQQHDAVYARPQRWWPWQHRRRSPLPLFRRVNLAPNSSAFGVEGGAGGLAASQLEAGDGGQR